MQVAINLMVNQLLGVSNECEVNEMAQLFSDFADGCLSVPINFPGTPYYTAMKVKFNLIIIYSLFLSKQKYVTIQCICIKSLGFFG